MLTRKSSGQGHWTMRMRSNKELGGMGCVNGDDDDDDDREKNDGKCREQDLDCGEPKTILKK